MTSGISLSWVYVKILFGWVVLVCVGSVLFLVGFAYFFLPMVSVDLLVIFGVFVFVDELAVLGAVCSVGSQPC